MYEPDAGVHAAALVGLPRCGTACLRALLENRMPGEVWAQIRSGELDPGSAAPVDRTVWRDHALGVDLDRLAADLIECSVVVTTRHDDEHPRELVHDIDSAPVLFRLGRSVDPSSPRVAIVGTRRCTPTGREIAFELGAGLARAGVSVVSGLALGIDGAAHRGALREPGAAPVAVVGSGLDVIYPRRNRDLWHEVANRGSVLSEAALGTPPEAWRFPARNRIIAALADVVIVVESKAHGGSMITVDEAIKRGCPVMAVPGSIRNRAAEGTNRLISEGCSPVCGVADVLVALDLVTAGPGPRLLTESGEPVPRVETPGEPGSLSALEESILDASDLAGLGLDELARRTTSPIGAVAASVTALEQRGLLSQEDGLVRRRITATPTSGGSADTARGPLASDG